MTTFAVRPAEIPTTVHDAPFRNDSHSSGVTWGAVIAGAFVAAALSLALLALGTGIGFSAVSPWSNSGASAAALGWTAIIWLVLTQLIASSVGGYLAGRLRVKWTSVHTHEVYFRDTAHGFLVWAVGLVVTAAFLTSAATSLVGGAARTGAAAAEAAGSSQGAALNQNSYFVDTLLRANASSTSAATASTTDSAAAAPANATLRTEIAQILLHSLREGNLSPADKSYLAQIVAAQTGLSQADAERRVDDVYNNALQAADRARKALAHSMYWTFLALLVGAFCASFAATIGGAQRDRVPIA
jgi:hypothetical protein